MEDSSAALAGPSLDPEVVDFVLRNVDGFLRSEFGASLGDPGIRIIDPCTGDGSFVAHLLQSELVPMRAVDTKYREDLFAEVPDRGAADAAAREIEDALRARTGRAERFPGVRLAEESGGVVATVGGSGPITVIGDIRGRSAAIDDPRSQAFRESIDARGGVVGVAVEPDDADAGSLSGRAATTRDGLYVYNLSTRRRGPVAIVLLVVPPRSAPA